MSDPVAPGAEEPVVVNLAKTAEQETARADIMKQIFGEIGELIEDFSCAVESTVLLHGRMYITDKFICFYSNLFGMEKKIRIPYSHITAITKEKTALVIPNAIAITTYRKEYLFRSFWDRDECFNVLKGYVRKYKTLSSRADHGVVPAAAGKDGDNSSTDAVKEIARNRSTTAVSTASIENEFETEEGGTSEKGGAAGGTRTPAEEKQALEDEIEKTKLKLLVVNDTIPVSIKEFAAKFVDGDASYGLPKHHEAIGDSKLETSAWSDAANQCGGREMKFYKPVNLPGLKDTRGVKIQRCTKFGDSGLVLCSSTRLEDVPCADCFSVDDVFVVKQIGEDKVSVDVHFEVKFVKSTMLKYAIESNTNGEMMKWLKDYVDRMKNVLKSGGGQKVTGNPAELKASLEAEASKASLKTSVLTDTLNISVKDFASMFVDEAGSYGLTKHHTAVGDSKLELTPWSNAADSSGDREMKFFKPVNLPGLKDTRGIKSQKCSKFGEAGLILASCTKVLDVPCADCFTSDDVFVVKDAGDGKVSVEVTFEVKFVKSTMMKYAIESNTSAEVLKWLKAYVEAMKTAIKNGGSGPAAAPLSPKAAALMAAQKVKDDEKAAKAATLMGKLDNLLESCGATGGRTFCVISLLLLITLMFFAIQWRNVSLQLSEQQVLMTEMSKILQELVSQQVCEQPIDVASITKNT